MLNDTKISKMIHFCQIIQFLTFRTRWSHSEPVCNNCILSDNTYQTSSVSMPLYYQYNEFFRACTDQEVILIHCWLISQKLARIFKETGALKCNFSIKFEIYCINEAKHCHKMKFQESIKHKYWRSVDLGKISPLPHPHVDAKVEISGGDDPPFLSPPALSPCCHPLEFEKKSNLYTEWNDSLKSIRIKKKLWKTQTGWL